MIKIKLFTDKFSNVSDLEYNINNWIEKNNYIIKDISHKASGNVIVVMIKYNEE